MKTIKIGDNLYTFEYSIEASLYPPCTELIMDTFINLGVGEAAAESQDVNTMVDTLKKTVSFMPTKTVSLFHAGLLEHHNFNEKESKELLKQYLKESGKAYPDVLSELMECLGEDNFFNLIGLNKMFAKNEQTERKTPKKSENLKPGENTSTAE